MVLDDNYSQIGIKSACRKPMYIGHDQNRTANQNYLPPGQLYQKRNVQKVELSVLLFGY